MRKQKKSDDKLIKLALITALVSLDEKIIELIIKLIEIIWGS